MCGRFVAASPPSALAEELGVHDVTLPDGELPLRWNVAPTMPVYAVAAGRDNRRRLGTMAWGFGNTLFNARAETLLERPAFRESFAHRRCLVPADAFYEWKDRRPVVVRRRDRGLLAFAGLWRREGRASACTIVTTSANATLEPYHRRMPVVLDQASWDAWLARDGDAEELSELLAPAAEDLLEVRWVAPLVNDVRNEGPELLTPADPPHPPQTLL